MHETGELRGSILLCRLSLFLLTLAAGMIMALDREEGFFPLNVFGSPQPVLVRYTAEFKHVTGLKFILGAMFTVAGYSLVQIVIAKVLLFQGGRLVGTKFMAWSVFIADMAISYLAASASAVGAEIAYLSKKGETLLLWNPVCDSFTRYCLVYGFSLAASFIGCVIAIFVATISAYHLFSLFLGREQVQHDHLSDTKPGGV